MADDFGVGLSRRFVVGAAFVLQAKP